MTEFIDNLLGVLYKMQADLTQKLYTSEREVQTEEKVSDASSLLLLPCALQLHIFTYLDFMQDIPNLLETCKSLNHLISSPQLLHLTFKPPPKKLIKKSSEILPQNDEEEKTKATNDNFSTKAEALVELKKTSAVNNFLNNKILNQEKKIEEKSSELEKLLQKLRIEKNIFNKVLGKISKVEENYEKILRERKTIDMYIENIESLEESEIKGYQNGLAIMENQVSELKNAVRVLGIEKRLQEFELNEKTASMTQFKNAFDKIRDFYLLMFEESLKSKIKGFEEISYNI